MYVHACQIATAAIVAMQAKNWADQSWLPEHEESRQSWICKSHMWHAGQLVQQRSVVDEKLRRLGSSPRTPMGDAAACEP